MALLFVHPDAPGAGPHYIFVDGVTPSRNTGIVTVKALVYASAAVRAAWKAANAALLDLHAQVTTKEDAAKDGVAAFAALSDSAKSEQRDAFQSAQDALKIQIAALKQQQSEKTAIERANKHKLVDEFMIPPSGVPIATDGAVSLADVYPWAVANKYVGATRAD